MTRCSYCNATILFGGIEVGEKRYCNARCRLKARSLLSITDPTDVSDLHAIITALHEELLQVADEVHALRGALAEAQERVDYLERSVAQLKSARNP
jgi:hypothetical protein